MLQELGTPPLPTGAEKEGVGADAPQELGSPEEKPARAWRRGNFESRGPNRLSPLTRRRRRWAPSLSPVLRLRREEFPSTFMPGSGDLLRCAALLLALYYRRMDGERFLILKELVVSVVPLGVLTIVVLVVILFGICTATESAAIGALGALYLAVMVKFPRTCAWSSLIGAILGFILGLGRGEVATLVVASSLGAAFVGTGVPFLIYLPKSPELRQNIKQSVFLTAKTTAMVCWLFVGSALFSSVFALHGGQGLIERWVLSMNLSPVGFLDNLAANHFFARLAARMD